MAKKANQHLYRESVSGVWYFQKKVRGIEKPYKFSLETKSVVEARRKRDERLKQIEINGFLPKVEIVDTPASTSKLFGEITKEWATIIKTRIEETTYFNYKKVINAKILPEFGDLPIENITTLDIEKFVSKLTCGSKTKQNILTPFRNVMRFAKKHKYIKDNPFGDMDPIKKTKNKQKRPLNMDEIRRFIDGVAVYWKTLFILLFFTGIRIAEATALKWKRLDLVNGTAHICRNLVRVEGGKIIYKQPKTEGSIRYVKLPGFVVEALIELRKRTWKGNDDDFVFTNRAGRCINPHTLNNTVIKPTLKKLGITTPISIKDTRVCYITNALDEGERMGFIQKQVGHASLKMIIQNYYRHNPAADDGRNMEKAWNSTSILPGSDGSNLEPLDIIK